MKVGDLVKIKKPPFIPGAEEGREREGQHGVIIDALEMNDGFYEFEVLFEDDVDWFSSLELENING
jgi:hypothetical protein|tara:strand:+ start:2677 stop:2874 length:198 start_codon:yes stop_codon:yes gene_type:complete